MYIKICQTDDCQGTVIAKGFCLKHYTRLRRHGNSEVCKNNMGSGNNQIERFWSRVALTANPNKCWEWQAAKQRGGYGVAFLNKKKWIAHRLAWFLVKDVVPQLHLLHSCDNPPCCNPNHLREGTDADNANDRIERGRTYHGERQWKARLTENDVREIRSLKGKISQSQIAKLFPTDQANVCRILSGKIWRSVK